MLDLLLESAKEQLPGRPLAIGDSRAFKPPIQKLSYTHDALIDLRIANPIMSQNELAAHFGYTPSWISQVMTSDAFQTRLAERKLELVDPLIRASIEEGFKGLANRSLEILKEKMNRAADDIPDQLALRTFELATRAAGYGAKIESRTEQNVHLHLDGMADRLTQLLVRKKAEADRVLEHDPQPTGSPA